MDRYFLALTPDDRDVLEEALAGVPKYLPLYDMVHDLEPARLAIELRRSDDGVTSVIATALNENVVGLSMTCTDTEGRSWMQPIDWPTDVQLERAVRQYAAARELERRDRYLAAAAVARRLLQPLTVTTPAAELAAALQGAYNAIAGALMAVADAAAAGARATTLRVVQ